MVTIGLYYIYYVHQDSTSIALEHTKCVGSSIRGNTSTNLTKSGLKNIQINDLGLTRFYS